MGLPEISKRAMVLVPAYNESSNIENTIKELSKYFCNIVVVDDGSTDDTLQILKKYKIKIIKHLLNIGQGGAIGTGLNYFLNFEELDYIITFDADGQHISKQAFEMLDFAIKNNKLAVLGSRFLKKDSIRLIPKIKKITLILASFYEYLFFSIKFSDAHNGIRVLHKKIVRDHLLPLDNFDMNHATELSKKICRSGLSFAEYPVDIIYKNKLSQSSLNSINFALANLFRSK
jgi:glycosyltransferase involved in cell wall biosynthesis